MIDYPESKTEAQWRAEDDARTLARAEEIKADETRMNNAKEAAVKMVEREKEEIQAMAKVAGKRVQSKSNDQSQDSANTVSKFNVFKKLK